MTFLLSKAFLFVRLSNGSYFQLSGMPIYNDLPLLASLSAPPLVAETAPEATEEPTKKRRLGMNARRRAAKRARHENSSEAPPAAADHIEPKAPKSAFLKRAAPIKPKRKRIELRHNLILYQQSYLPFRPNFPRGRTFFFIFLFILVSLCLFLTHFLLIFYSILLTLSSI